jgi:hypothetical protein
VNCNLPTTKPARLPLRKNWQRSSAAQRLCKRMFGTILN